MLFYILQNYCLNKPLTSLKCSKDTYFWDPKLGIVSVDAVVSRFCESAMLSLLVVGRKIYGVRVFSNDIRAYQFLQRLFSCFRISILGQQTENK
jgi:hypothetical protein